MVNLPFAGTPTGMAGFIPGPSVYCLVGDGCRPAGGRLPAMGIYRPNDRRCKPLVGFGDRPPARGVCCIFTEKVPPLVLVELVLLDWRKCLWRMALRSVGVDPLSPVEFLESHPFLLSLLRLDLSPGAVLVAEEGRSGIEPGNDWRREQSDERRGKTGEAGRSRRRKWSGTGLGPGPSRPG